MLIGIHHAKANYFHVTDIIQSMNMRRLSTFIVHSSCVLKMEPWFIYKISIPHQISRPTIFIGYACTHASMQTSVMGAKQGKGIPHPSPSISHKHPHTSNACKSLYIAKTLRARITGEGWDIFGKQLGSRLDWVGEAASPNPHFHLEFQISWSEFT